MGQGIVLLASAVPFRQVRTYLQRHTGYYAWAMGIAGVPIKMILF